MTTTNFLAADLGASNGRVVLARWDGSRFELQELHRFANGPVNVLGRLHTDILMLWSEVKAGMARYAAAYSEPVTAIGIDTWGVDYGLFDGRRQLLGNPVHYRDARTVGMMERLFKVVPQPEVFAGTGLQFIALNTLFQLYAMKVQGDPLLNLADSLLLTPDIFHFWLSGEQIAEYTIASTTQMLDARQRKWATGLLDQLGLPTHMLPPIVQPGTIVGPMLAQVAEESGLRNRPQIVASASHDTAAAVAGTPGLTPRAAYLSSGTWSLFGLEVPEPIINPTALALNITNEGGVEGTIRLLKNVTGLWLLQESRRQWEREGRNAGWSELLAEAEAAAPFRSLIDPDAADFGAPINMVAAIQGYCRATRQPVPESRGEVVRCCLESLALRYRWTVNALERLSTGEGNPPIDTIRVVGGGSQNYLLNQFTADACQRTVITGPVEAAILGNVMMQAVAVGELANVREGREAIATSFPQEVVEPRTGGGWDVAFGRFEELTA